MIRDAQNAKEFHPKESGAKNQHWGGFGAATCYLAGT
jgi:hypothetical protein